MTIKNKIILQAIFLISQFGLLLPWFGHKSVDETLGVTIVLGGTMIYPLLFLLFVFLLWTNEQSFKWCRFLYGLLFINAWVSEAIWYYNYHFITDISLHSSLLLPGFYLYLFFVFIGWCFHNIYYIKTGFMF